ncbi:MAG: phage terminase small subunit P27 family [Mycobacterium sp.]|nr:phage terminase small subunit P27 family [Mycobacterium sp.]
MPPRKPVEQKRLTGRSPGRDAGGRALPEPVVVLAQAVGAPEPPSSLKDAGRDEWQRLWTAGRSWLSPNLDLFVMERLCQNHDLRAAMLTQIERDGLTVEGYKGQPRPHPLLSEVRAVEAETRKLEIECGFTPASRSKLGYAEVKRVSKIDEMARRRRATES